MNIERMQRVAEVIIQHPEDFSMAGWGYKSFCHTTGCIGGWAVMLFDEEFKRNSAVIAKNRSIDGYISGDIATVAARILGLTNKESSRLFFSNNWDADLANKYDSSKKLSRRDNQRRKAYLAVEQIYRLIAEYKGKNPDPVETKNHNLELEAEAPVEEVEAELQPASGGTTVADQEENSKPEPTHVLPTLDDQVSAFEERMAKKQVEENLTQAEKDARTAERLRQEYLQRTGRKEMKP